MNMVRSRRKFLVALFAFGILWAGVLFAWSYCWGWVGQASPVLQYFVRPVCPAMSAEARYPDTIDVIVPAHLDPEIHPTYVSPSGRYIVTRLNGAAPPGTYLYDTRTDEITRTEYFDYTFAVFVTEAWVVTQKDDFYVYNIHDGERVPLTLLDVTVDPDTHTPQMSAGDVAQLRQADTVVLVPFDSMGVAVGLGEGFPNESPSNVVAANLDVSFDEIRAFLEQQEIDYQLQTNGVDGAEASPHVAPHGGLYYRSGWNEPTRILTHADDREVVRSPFWPDRFRAEGWAHRGTGVILYPDISRHVISLGYAKGIFEVPDPILALRVPPEYLPTEVRSDVEAKQSRERVAEYGALALFGAVFVGGIVAGWYVYMRRNGDIVTGEEV